MSDFLTSLILSPALISTVVSNIQENIGQLSPVPLFAICLHGNLAAV